MSGRFWPLATLVTGLATLALFVVFAMLPEAQAAAQCAPPGAVVQFELARNLDDLIAIFGAPDSDCRPLMVAAMDAVNHVDVWAFIPAYTLFCICGALFLSNGVLTRPLTVAAVVAAVLAAAGDYLETTTLLQTTHTLDEPGNLLTLSQVGAWSKFALLAAHALFCAGLCYLSTPRRLIVGVLLVLPTFGVAIASLNHVTLANAMNLSFALAWLGLLVSAAIALARAKGSPA